MNEKTINWISVLVILMVLAWLYKLQSLTEQHWLLIVFLPMGVGVVYRVLAWKFARSVVIRRRRLLKGLWRRGQDGDLTMGKYEEEIIVLLGRIKMALPFTIGSVLIVVGIACFRDEIAAFSDILANTMLRMFAPGLSLGSIFLAARLQVIAKAIDRALPPDAKRELPTKASMYLPSQRVRVEIDRYKVHDFILPQAALPFWRMQEAERWLGKCGFRRVGPRVWEANGEALRYLDDDEILAVELVGSGPT